MKTNKIIYAIMLLAMMAPLSVAAQHDHDHDHGHVHDHNCTHDHNDSIKQNSELKAVKVKSHRRHGISRINGAENGMLYGQEVLSHAACCNLGESFVTNPSVDVNYNDAATGARQIKLLGLSGQYVQMLAEGLSMGSGAAMPYQLGYVPGSWMKSIAVSKGASSVKSGFQSITGQIDVTYLKPEEEEGLIVNFYGDQHMKAEGNVMGNIHLNKYLSTEVLAHYEHDLQHNADVNEDGWIDVPGVRQFNLQNRWNYVKGHYIFHGGIGLIDENRHGGTSPLATVQQPVDIATRRYEAYMKHAFILNHEHNTNVALLATAFRNELDGTFFHADYSNRHNSLDARLVLEHEFNHEHSLSAGISLLAERLTDSLTDDRLSPLAEQTILMTVPGAYAQYTFKPSHHLTLMAGMRADQVGGDYNRTIFTPRLHIKWMPTDYITLRASTGKGYRLPYALAENHYLLAAWRPMVINNNLPIEEAWNTGIVAAINIPTHCDKLIKINAEYYYTNFLAQTLIDFDSDPSKILITALDGESYSHTAQVDVNYAPVKELDFTAAFRLSDVRCTYNGVLKEKPLTSRYKALFTAAWKPDEERWQFDFTFCLNGPGRLPAQVGSGESEFAAYPSLNMQVMRRFRNWSVYLGGENLTNYQQAAPMLSGSTSANPIYDPSLVYGPIRGAMAYIGVRLNFWKE